MSFADLGLSPKLLEAIAAAGYEHPTPIQKEAIPPALLGHDVLGIAQTGTGKTASFTLPMIERLSKGRAKARMPRSLVLAPTRELAAQIRRQPQADHGAADRRRVVRRPGFETDARRRCLDRNAGPLH